MPRSPGRAATRCFFDRPIRAVAGFAFSAPSRIHCFTESVLSGDGYASEGQPR